MRKALIHTDGASKGNPGPAGIGVVIAWEDGSVAREIGEYIGVATNNVAEYKALIRGLREAADLGASEVLAYTDSELLAFQIHGVYKVKSSKLKPLHEQAVALISAFKTAKVRNVPREMNLRADELANEGIRKHSQPNQHAEEQPIEPPRRQRGQKALDL